MKSLFLSLALSLLCLAGCTSQQAQPTPTPVVIATPSPSPDLQVCCGDETVPEGGTESLLLRRDLGQVDQGDVLVAEFKIINNSDEPAKLDGKPKYSLPCCVKVRVEPETIPARGEGKLTVSFDTKWRKGPSEVFVNLPFRGGQATNSFLLEALVRPSFVVEPTSVDLSDGLPKEFSVGGPDLFKTFKVLSVEPTDPRVKITESARLDDMIIYEVSWTGDGPGNKVEFAVVKTDHPKVKEYPVGVTPPGIDSRGRVPKRIGR